MLTGGQSLNPANSRPHATYSTKTKHCVKHISFTTTRSFAANSAKGRSTTFDYNDAKTRMQKAESDQIQAKYEFIFRTKILDFYAGFPLTL